MMKRLIVLALVTIITFGFSGIGMAEEFNVVVTGSSWDSDSRGFASIGGLSVQQGTKLATRRGSRISVDGRPDVFAISGKAGVFELAFTTDQPTFRLIVEGDRFPRTITQPFTIPEGGGEIDVGRVNSPRAEGPEHTWPLPMVATAWGYGSSHEMLADNKAAIRLLTFGSGADGAPKWAYPMNLSFPGSTPSSATSEPTTTSPFLMRVPQSEYVIPFDMNTQDTYFLPIEENTGAWIIIVSFAPGEGLDKDVILQIKDTVTDELLDPPRPWKFSPKTISVRNGYATEVRYQPDIDQ
ncbi:MAG: hypothetical protein ACYST9_05860 [Planctomycetota bacterium]